MGFTPEKREELRFIYEHEVASGQKPDDTLRFEGFPFLLSYTYYLLKYLDDQLPVSELVKPPLQCEIDNTAICDVYYEARLATGTAWTHMCPKCFTEFGTGRFGPTDAKMFRRKSESLFVQVK